MSEDHEVTINGVQDDVAISDIILGMKLASLSITDDQENTLANVIKMNPWHEQALRMITGSTEEAHKPLSYLLDKYFGLQLDHHIDESGLTKGGHFLDTQGYIAHNDDTIVLAYRCTTSFFDWLTNFNTTSSEWEIDQDVAQGFSGYCSSLEGLWCCRCGKAGKPRVHTGFYNNFLATVPCIEEHILPLLGPDQPPRKLYVVGHSLGAGIAALAGMYFLLEHDWNKFPQSLVTVTAGCPRACLGGMQENVKNTLASTQNTQFFRIVRDKDVVATVPPAFLGYKHVGRLVFISEDNVIQLDSDFVQDDGNQEDVKREAATAKAAKYIPEQHEGDDNADEVDDDKVAYEKKIAMIPKAFKDHMPDFYMAPMRALKADSFPEDHVEKKRALPEEEEDGGKKKSFLGLGWIQ